MTTTTIQAPGAGGDGFSTTAGNDGTLTIAVGPTGAKVNAMVLDAAGNPTFLKAPIAPYVSGQIAQVLITADAGSSTTATTFANVSATNQSITPKSTSSRIIVECSFNAGVANFTGVNTIGTFQLYDATNSVLLGTPQLVQAPSVSGGIGASSGMNLKWYVSNAALTARSFQLQGKTNNASAAASASACTWTLTEVQN